MVTRVQSNSSSLIPAVARIDPSATRKLASAVAGLRSVSRWIERTSDPHRAPGLAALVQNALPDTIDGLLELWSGCGSNLVQVRLGRATHDQEVLFRHAPHDRIADEQFGRLADRSNPRP